MKKRLCLAYTVEYLLPHFVEKDSLPVPITLARMLDISWVHYTRPLGPKFDHHDYPFRVIRIGSHQHLTNRLLLDNSKETECSFSMWFSLRSAISASFSSDILVTGHLNVRTALAMLSFKMTRRLLGRRAFCYIKADTDPASIRRLAERSCQSARIIDRIRYWVLKATTNVALDVISVESDQAYTEMCRAFPELAPELLVIRNCPPDSFFAGEPPPQIGERQKQILAVARFGSHQKATDILLEGFARFHALNRDWRLIMVGPSSTEFERFLVAHRDLVEQGAICYLGAIQDKERMRALYCESRIFALPSRYEGSSVALVEACCLGCVPVCTPVGSFRDALGEYHDRLTVPVDNIDALAMKFTDIAAYPDLMCTVSRYLIERGRNLRWEEQVRPLARIIRSSFDS
jgi:glycosyltransferase involved in cell wall biosynthesis